jgi:pimeloyl-ACP methyl ester carboxylesterase
MAFATVDGIRTRYEVFGAGPPLLLFSPGGFNATIENWRAFGIYARLNLLDHLPERYTCIAFDKRESGESGGRVEAITWDDYARQGIGLLDELGIGRTHLLGGCIGCSIALHAAAAAPERALSLVLYSPAGGPEYRATQARRFAEHLAFVVEHGLAAVVELARAGTETFTQDPRLGPWVSVVRTDDEFASRYARLESTQYAELVNETAAGLFDLDAVPGAPPDLLARIDVPALVVPGDDPNHATSAARYLAESLPRAEYWDVHPSEQTAENAPARVLQFLSSSDSPRSSAAI